MSVLPAQEGHGCRRMADNSKGNLSGASPEAKELPWLDPDLVSSYLELQVRLLNFQLDSAQKEALASQEDAALAASTSRLWRKAAPTAVIVTLLAAAVALLAAVTWDDLWRGLKFSATQQVGFFQGMSAFGGFLRDWKDVFLGLVGGSVLITFKRLAYRSLSSALVIVLGIALSTSLLVGLVIADVNLVRENVVPQHVAWRGWGVVAVAVVTGVALMIEVSDLATSAGPAAFLARSQWYERVRRAIAWFTMSTWLGRFLDWLVTPRRWGRLFAILGVLTATSVVLWGVAIVGAIVTTSSNGTYSRLWDALFYVGYPVGPLWWLWLLTALVTSPAGRHPADGRVTMAIFAVAPGASLVAFATASLAKASYSASGDYEGVGPLIVLLAIVVWVLWFIWAGLTLPTTLRITYLPLVVCFFLGTFMYYGTLPFLALGAVLSAGVPISLWRFRAASARMPLLTPV